MKRLLLIVITIYTKTHTGKKGKGKTVQNINTKKCVLKCNGFALLYRQANIFENRVYADYTQTWGFTNEELELLDIIL